MSAPAVSRSSEAFATPPGHAPQSPDRPIDLVHLSKYTLGDRSLESELLTLFRNQAGVYLCRLENSMSETDWHAAAHSLKGSARSIGATRVADCAAEAESLAAAESVLRFAALDRLRSAVQDADAYIGVILGE